MQLIKFSEELTTKFPYGKLENTNLQMKESLEKETIFMFYSFVIYDEGVLFILNFYKNSYFMQKYCIK